jgi:GTPase Era involved in 16S rRNA processing
MILLGKAGTGKSSTGNSILGQRVFDSSAGGNLNTNICAMKATDRFGHKLLVIDTPGICEDDRTLTEEIQQSVVMAQPGKKVFLLCVAMRRLTKEDDLTFQEYAKCFGHEMYQFTIVVFTHLDQWQASMEDAGEIPDTMSYMNSLPPFAKKFIRKCFGRSICFSNRCTEDDMNTQVHSLLHEIGNIYNQNNEQCYTEEMLSKVIVQESFWSRISNNKCIATSIGATATAYALYKRVVR